MRIFLLLFWSLAVAVALPVQDWVPVESLVEPPGERNPLLGDILPMQGHVIQEDPKPVVQVKPAELNPVQKRQLVNSRSLETEQQSESVMNGPRGQVQAPLNMREAEEEPVEEPVEEVELVQSIQEVAQPMIQQEPEKEETFVEDEENFLQEEAKAEEELVMGKEAEDTLAEDDRMIDAVDAAQPITQLNAVPEPHEAHHRNPNEFLEEPVMELEPKKEVFVEDADNILQKEASKEREELVMGLEPQEALAEEQRNILQEEELLDAVEPPVMEHHEVYHRNPNEFLEEPVMELEPKKEEVFVEDGDNILQEEASKEREELVMGLKPQEALADEQRNILQEEELLDAVEPPVMEHHEVYHRNQNAFIEEPVMELEPEKEETFVEDEENFLQEEAKADKQLVMGLKHQDALAEEQRNILQEEELLDAVVEPPVMEHHEVYHRNQNAFFEEPVVELEPEKEETFVEDEENFLQEEALKEGEELVMGLKPQEALVEEQRNILQEEELLDAVGPPLMQLDAVPEPHEVHQRNPNEFMGAQVMELQSEGRFIEDEDNFMQQEALMEKPEGAQGPPMQGFSEIETEYHTALDPALGYEPSQDELLMPYQIQQGTKEAESNMMENLPSEEELMMADQAYLGESLMNQNARERREDNGIEPPDSDPSNNGRQSCSGVVIDGKCYVFFSGPKKAPDAEFFCQKNFESGHLASVTSRYVHDQMMGLMDRNGGRRRTWIGGLRYLDTGRWIWLDGARWVYADWLPGEPNNTAGVENCVEILSNEKFNDMPCWDLRAFICSYPFYEFSLPSAPDRT